MKPSKKTVLAFFGIQGKKSVGKERNTWSFQSGLASSGRRPTKGNMLELKTDELLKADMEPVPRTVTQS